MEKKLERFGWETIVTALFFAIIGIILICFPDITMKFVDVVIGILFIIIGVLKIADYYSVKRQYDFFNYDAFYGIIGIILGIIAIFFGEQFNQAFRAILGIWIIYSGIIKMIFATKINSIDKSIGTTSLLVSFIIIICGIFILIFENAIMMTLGIILMIYSVMEIISGLIYVNNIKKIFNALKKSITIINEK